MNNVLWDLKFMRCCCGYNWQHYKFSEITHRIFHKSDRQITKTLKGDIILILNSTQYKNILKLTVTHVSLYEKLKYCRPPPVIKKERKLINCINWYLIQIYTIFY